MKFLTPTLALSSLLRRSALARAVPALQHKSHALSQPSRSYASSVDSGKGGCKKGDKTMPILLPPSQSANESSPADAAASKQDEPFNPSMPESALMTPEEIYEYNLENPMYPGMDASSFPEIMDGDPAFPLPQHSFSLTTTSGNGTNDGSNVNTGVPMMISGPISFGGLRAGRIPLGDVVTWEHFHGGEGQAQNPPPASKHTWMNKLKPPKEMKKVLDQYVVGQEEAKTLLCVAVWNHYTRVKLNLKAMETPESEDRLILDKSNVLLLGPSGSGKTLLVKNIAKLLDVPYSHNDATTFTQVGYIGEDSDVCIMRLYKNAGEDVERAQTGIVFIDEIDKIARKQDGGTNTRDVCGEGVQNAFLKMLEGSVVTLNDKTAKKRGASESINIDTSNILFIVSGAFVGLESFISERTNKTSIGFGASLRDSPSRKQAEEATIAAPSTPSELPAPILNPLSSVEPIDLVKFGLIPEFVGRIPIVVALHKLSVTDLMHVLTSPKDSLIRQYETLFSQFDVKLEITEDAIVEIAKIAHTRGTGARGLRSIVERLLAAPNFEAPGGNIAKVTIDGDVVKGLKKPILEEKEDSVEVMLEAEIVRQA